MLYLDPEQCDAAFNRKVGLFTCTSNTCGCIIGDGTSNVLNGNENVKLCPTAQKIVQHLYIRHKITLRTKDLNDIDSWIRSCLLSIVDTDHSEQLEKYARGSNYFLLREKPEPIEGLRVYKKGYQ